MLFRSVAPDGPGRPDPLRGGRPQRRVGHDRRGRVHGHVPHVRHQAPLDVHGAGAQVDEDGGDVDLDRADLGAGPAQGGGEGQGVDGVVVGQALGNVAEAPVREKPCYVKKRGQRDGSYVRTGDGDHKMSLYEIDRFIENQHRSARNDAATIRREIGRAHV